MSRIYWIQRQTCSFLLGSLSCWLSWHSFSWILCFVGDFMVKVHLVEEKEPRSCGILVLGSITLSCGSSVSSRNWLWWNIWCWTHSETPQKSWLRMTSPSTLHLSIWYYGFLPLSCKTIYIAFWPNLATYPVFNLFLLCGLVSLVCSMDSKIEHTTQLLGLPWSHSSLANG